jgi:hypothetical protein
MQNIVLTFGDKEETRLKKSHKQKFISVLEMSFFRSVLFRNPSLSLFKPPILHHFSTLPTITQRASQNLILAQNGRRIFRSQASHIYQKFRYFNYWNENERIDIRDYGYTIGSFAGIMYFASDTGDMDFTSMIIFGIFSAGLGGMIGLALPEMLVLSRSTLPLFLVGVATYHISKFINKNKLKNEKPEI